MPQKDHKHKDHNEVNIFTTTMFSDCVCAVGRLLQTHIKLI